MTDKQIEAEARELYMVWLNIENSRDLWLNIATKARELADARYKPLVDAVEQALRVMGPAGGPMIALRRELDNLKGGS